MSISHLKTLLAIAESGSFVGAADSIHITQAAVSMQMKLLESNLGMELFDRSKRPPVLNETGLVLIPRAREIVQSYDRFMQSSKTLNSQVGSLCIGAVPSVFSGVFPSALADLRRRDPQLHVTVSSGLSSSLVQQVERGAIDAAIITEPPYEQPGLRWTLIGKEELVVIASLDSPNLPPEQLLETKPFIRFNRSAWVGKIIEDYLNELGINVKEGMELNSLDAISSMVFHGLGVSVIPRRKSSYHGAYAIKQISFTKNVPYRKLGLLERADNPKQNLTQILGDELFREIASNLVDV